MSKRFLPPMPTILAVTLLSLAGVVWTATIKDATIAELMDALASDSSRERNQAEEELIRRGRATTQHDAITNTCMRLLARTDDPELQFRLKNVMKALVTRQAFRDRAFLGVRLRQSRAPLRVEGSTYVPVDIMMVLPDTAALKHGLRAGDRILQIDDKVCRGSFDITRLIAYIGAQGPGHPLKMILWSGGEKVRKTVVLGQRPGQIPGELPEETRKEVFFRQWLKEHLPEGDSGADVH